MGDDVTLSPLKQAFVALQRANARIAELESLPRESIAVVGVGCRFPGGICNAENYWDFLKRRADAVGSEMEARWLQCGADLPAPDASLNRGALLDDPSLFDPLFFGISPREAAYIDPQQRLLLEVSWEALEDAGIAPGSTFNTRTGVYVGIAGSDYGQLQLSNGGLSAINPHFASGSAHSVASGRLSYTLGLRGPSLSIDTACSSSLVAVHQACAGLRAGDCDLALAGGVNLILTPESSVAFCRSGMLSSRGVIGSFSSAADGFVRGEGCGVVVLKRLRDAEASGDRILGVIRGSAVNHDGPTSGLTVPSGAAQQLLLRSALASAALSPAAIGYVEAHGTGTRLGDPIEAEALGAVFAGDRARPLAIGSVKTNLGHLEAAAGMAGLIKLLLALEHREIPAQLHFDQPSELIRWTELPLEVVTGPRRWEPIAGRRIGGVSAFGFSGTNAHLIVEEAPARQQPMDGTAVKTQVLAISAKTEDALLRMATRYRTYLESHPELRWDDVCHTAGVGRTHFQHRLAVVAASVAEAVERLRAYEQSARGAGLIEDRATLVTDADAEAKSLVKQAADAPRELSADELARAYMAGADVDWMGINRGQPSQRIPLPGYAFERQRHWFAAPSGSKPSGSKQSGPPSGVATGHPLLGMQLRSAAAAAQYEQTISPTGDLAWLAEHRIAGRVLMPAAAFAEMLLAAADRMDGEGAAGAAMVEELVLSRPLELDPERLIQLVADPSNATPGSLRVRVYSAPASPPAEWLLHAEGTVRRRQNAVAINAKPDLDQVRLRCPQALDAQSFYREMRTRGADFGPRFRQVQRVWSNAEEALGEVSLEPLGERIHPASLDACLQVAAVLLGGDKTTLLPLSLESLAFRATAIPDLALVYVTKAAGHADSHIRPDGSAARLTRINLQIFAPDHTPITDNITISFAQKHEQAKDEPSDWTYELSWRVAPLPRLKPTLPKHWTLVLQGHEPDALFIKQISNALEEQGQTVAIVDVDSAMEASGELRQILDERRERVLYLHRPIRLNADEDSNVTDAARPAIEGLLALTRALIGSERPDGQRLYVITHRSHTVANRESPNPLEALISGIAATIAVERPASRCTRLDLEHDAFQHEPHAAIAELLADDAEDWVAFRGDTRYLPRLERTSRAGATGPQTLTFLPGGGLASLKHEAVERQTPADDEIEIEVRAAALNFHDVLSAIDLLQDKDPLGTECSGIVRRVGAHVTNVSEGDEVLAIAPGCFSTYAIANQALALRKPASLSFQQAASLPVAYLTADYCLHTLARVSPAKRVLIHAASGGVGIAAVRLCLRAGAEVYATAGSTGKREFLRSLGVRHVMDSRSDSFAEQVRSLTEGRGVDVVLNSLAGRLTDAGLSVTAEGATFIDIGRTDIRTEQQVAAQHPGVRYRAVDLTRQLVEDARGMGDRLQRIVHDIASGALPTLPVEAFDWDDAADAFRHMAAAKHIGKIVLTKRSISRSATEIDPQFDLGSAFLVTGGLTGLGLEAVEWLASKKVGKIVIVARTPVSDGYADRLDQLRQLGVEIVVIRGDVASAEVIGRAMEEAGPRLRGILHCAGAVDDAPLEKQTWSTFEHALAGKANGAWLLHRATRSMALDFFVLFSSWASIAGAPQAANYCAANVFLDSLAAYRRSINLVATSISWGAWNNLGMAAARSEQGFLRRGLIPFTAAEGKLALEHALLRQSEPHIALAKIDWRRFKAAAQPGQAPSLYADLLPGFLRNVPEESLQILRPKNAFDEIRSAPAEARMELLQRRIDETLAHVLGLASSDAIDPEQPLEAVGMDSILSVEIKNALSLLFGDTLPMTLLFDYPSAGALTRYLAARFHLQQEQPEKDPAKSILDELETMSDDEVQKVLTALN